MRILCLVGIKQGCLKSGLTGRVFCHRCTDDSHCNKFFCKSKLRIVFSLYNRECAIISDIFVHLWQPFLCHECTNGFHHNKHLPESKLKMIFSLNNREGDIVTDIFTPSGRPYGVLLVLKSLRYIRTPKRS